MAGQIVPVEGGEGELFRVWFDDILRLGDGQQFQIAAVKLDRRVSGAERMLGARRQREAQRAIGRAHRVEVAAGKHQMVDALQRIVLEMRSRCCIMQTRDTRRQGFAARIASQALIVGSSEFT